MTLGRWSLCRRVCEAYDVI